jgi:hypothetical protein
MKIETGKYDTDTRDVPVTFTLGEIVHQRRVNACHDQSGAYDAKATEDRIAQVALGVAAKIDAGVITPVVEEPAPLASDEAAKA